MYILPIPYKFWGLLFEKLVKLSVTTSPISNSPQEQKSLRKETDSY